MIRGVIFDLGGTLVDRYSLSPIHNISKAFKFRNINLSNELISKDMGLRKYDHIMSISNETEFRDKFMNMYNRPHSHNDLIDIYSQFNIFQNNYLKKYVDIIPEVKKATDMLKDRNIKIGITTGFNQKQMDYCIQLLNKHNIYPDSAVSSTNFMFRPNPDMIYENMKQMGIDNPKQILKVDDTNIGIQEGRNAGCLTVGVARWSVNMNIYSYESLLKLSDNDIKEKLKLSRLKLHLSEPTYLINTLEQLHHCL